MGSCRMEKGLLKTDIPGVVYFYNVHEVLTSICTTVVKARRGRGFQDHRPFVASLRTDHIYIAT